jgi:hypothetical protein
LGDSQTIECISKHFQYKPPATPQPATGIFANANPERTHLIRWRLYSTGGALAMILDRIYKGDWKSKIASGTSFEALLDESINSKA